jgi:hypothetical protein
VAQQVIDQLRHGRSVLLTTAAGDATASLVKLIAQTWESGTVAGRARQVTCSPRTTADQVTRASAPVDTAVSEGSTMLILAEAHAVADDQAAACFAEPGVPAVWCADADRLHQRGSATSMTALLSDAWLRGDLARIDVPPVPPLGTA